MYEPRPCDAATATERFDRKAAGELKACGLTFADLTDDERLDHDSALATEIDTCTRLKANPALREAYRATQRAVAWAEKRRREGRTVWAVRVPVSITGASSTPASAPRPAARPRGAGRPAARRGSGISPPDLRYREIDRDAEGRPTVRFVRSNTEAGKQPIPLTPERARMLTRRRTEAGAGPGELVFPSMTG